MGFWKKLFNSNTTQQGLGIAAQGGYPTNAGEYINADNALEISTVYACVRVIADTISVLPLHVFKVGPDDSRTRDYSHPVRKLLKRPNPWMGEAEWKSLTVLHLLLRGNAYWFIRRDASGVTTALLPLAPDDVEVLSFESEIFYHHRPSGITYLAEDILHFKGLSIAEGYVGLNPIAYHRQTLGEAKAAGRHAAALLGNAARPATAVKVPNKLDEPSFKRLRDQFAAAYQGAANAGKNMILDNGMDIVPLQMTNDDMQYLQTRQLTRTEIAALFRVPPHKVGDLSRATFSNIEHQSREFLSDCIAPWLVRITQEINHKLLAANEKIYAEFVTDALVMADLLSRYQAYAIGRQNGWLSANDIRVKENMNKIDGGDAYLIPLNMTKASDALQQSLKTSPPPNKPTPKPAPSEAEDDQDDAED